MHSIARFTTRELHAAEAALEADFRWAIRRAQAAYAAAEGALDRLPSIDIPGAFRSLRARLSRAEKLLLGGALVGQIVRTIARHLPWYRCSNVSKAARRLCGLNTDLLDSLIAGSLIIAGSISLVDFAKDTQAFTEEFEKALSFFLRELHGQQSADDANRQAYLALHGQQSNMAA